MAWQNACTRALTSCVVRRQRSEDDARCAQHDRERTRLDRADPERGRLLVAGARDLRRLAHGREPLLGYLERAEHLVAPAPVCDVEEQRAGGVGRIDGPLASESIAHVVLRQDDPPDALVDVRLVPSEPEELRRGEPGECAVPGERDQALEPDAILDLRALRSSALIVPEDRGPEDSTLVVEAHEAVHLAGEPDARTVHAEASECGLARSPPVLGVLLGPPGIRRRQPVMLLRGGEHLAARADRKRLDAGGADVEPDERVRHAPSAE